MLNFDEEGKFISDPNIGTFTKILKTVVVKTKTDYVHFKKI